MDDVHFNRKVYSEWPEGEGSNESHKIIEERKEHGNHGHCYDVNCPAYEPQHVEVVRAKQRDFYGVLFLDQLVSWPCLGTLCLHKVVEGLAKHLFTMQHNMHQSM